MENVSDERPWETDRNIGEIVKSDSGFQTEYQAIHAQRLSLIRSYNLWYAFGYAVSVTMFALLLVTSLSVSSLPLMVASAAVATLIVWFAYRVVVRIDRDVVGLYPRIIFLELILGYDFYRDYLRRRPRGETERAFIEQCEQVGADTTQELWRAVYSIFDAKSFPGSRRLTNHFRLAAYLGVLMYWIIIAVIVSPQYFGGG